MQVCALGTIGIPRMMYMYRRTAVLIASNLHFILFKLLMIAFTASGMGY